MVNNRAIFFDRDGVLIEAPISKDGKPKSIKSLKNLKLIKGIKKVCNYYKKKNFKLFMVTNQPDFSRKNNTKKNINLINNYLKKKLGLKYNFICFCDNDSCFNRKPNPGMLKKAEKKFNINLKKSFMIGDRWRDIGAGKKAGCQTVFIERHYSEKKKYKPNFQIKSLDELYNIII